MIKAFICKDKTVEQLEGKAQALLRGDE